MFLFKTTFVRQRRWAAVCTFFATLFFNGTASATPFSAKDSSWDGLSGFASLATDGTSGGLSEDRFVATQTLDHSALTPSDSVIFVHPEHPPKIDSLARFMRDGGRLILVDDYGAGDSILKHFGMDRLPATKSPARMFGNNPELPLAEPASAHQTVVDVTTVTLNHPTAIRHPELNPVLEIRNRTGAGTSVVAIAGAVQRGHLFVVADSSVFINEMLRFPGNRAFAKGVLAYAADDDTWGKRSGRVYLVTGAFTEVGQYGAEPGVLTDLSEKLGKASELVSDIRDHGLPATGAYASALMLAIVIAVWVYRNATKIQRHFAPKYLVRVPLAAQGGPAGRAALLSLPSTDKALTLLEWRYALDAALRLALGKRQLPRAEALYDAVRPMLGDAAARELRALLLILSEAETSVLARGAGTRVKARDLDQTGARVRNLVKALREHERTHL
jgi:hypothetical protein